MLLYNLGGYFAAFQLVKAEWRSCVKEQLYRLADAESIVAFTFSKKDFDVSEDEFVQNGRFYDVIKYEVTGDKITVYCFDDGAETTLTAQFHDILNQNITQKTDFQGKTT